MATPMATRLKNATQPQRKHALFDDGWCKKVYWGGKRCPVASETDPMSPPNSNHNCLRHVYIRIAQRFSTFQQASILPENGLVACTHTECTCITLIPKLKNSFYVHVGFCNRLIVQTHPLQLPHKSNTFGGGTEYLFLT